MRIFPEGTRDWMGSTGQVFIILAYCMLAIAVAAFAFKTWVLYSWPRVNGVVINSRVELTVDSDNGTPMCSAVESVQYRLDGLEKVVQSGGHSFTSDCKAVKAKVAAAQGQTRTVVFNRRAPGATYVNPGFNIEFYLISVVLTFLAGAFGFAGWVAVRVSQWMVKRGIDLP